VPPGAAIRAQGFVTGGFQNGSSWFVESRLPQVRPVIVADQGAPSIASGRYAFHIEASAGQGVVTEVSTNLADWAGLSTNTVGTGPLLFSDPAWASYPMRYYRLRSPP